MAIDYTKLTTNIGFAEYIKQGLDSQLPLLYRLAQKEGISSLSPTEQIKLCSAYKVYLREAKQSCFPKKQGLWAKAKQEFGKLTGVFKELPFAPDNIEKSANRQFDEEYALSTFLTKNKGLGLLAKYDSPESKCFLFKTPSDDILRLTLDDIIQYNLEHYADNLLLDSTDQLAGWNHKLLETINPVHIDPDKRKEFYSLLASAGKTGYIKDTWEVETSFNTDGKDYVVLRNNQGNIRLAEKNVWEEEKNLTTLENVPHNTTAGLYDGLTLGAAQTVLNASLNPPAVASFFATPIRSYNQIKDQRELAKEQGDFYTLGQIDGINITLLLLALKGGAKGLLEFGRKGATKASEAPEIVIREDKPVQTPETAITRKMADTLKRALAEQKPEPNKPAAERVIPLEARLEAERTSQRHPVPVRDLVKESRGTDVLEEGLGSDNVPRRTQRAARSDREKLRSVERSSEEFRIPEAKIKEIKTFLRDPQKTLEEKQDFLHAEFKKIYGEKITTHLKESAKQRQDAVVAYTDILIDEGCDIDIDVIDKRIFEISDGLRRDENLPLEKIWESPRSALRSIQNSYLTLREILIKEHPWGISKEERIIDDMILGTVSRKNRETLRRNLMKLPKRLMKDIKRDGFLFIITEKGPGEIFHRSPEGTNIEAARLIIMKESEGINTGETPFHEIGHTLLFGNRRKIVEREFLAIRDIVNRKLDEPSQSEFLKILIEAHERDLLLSREKFLKEVFCTLFSDFHLDNVPLYEVTYHYRHKGKPGTLDAKSTFSVKVTFQNQEPSLYRIMGRIHEKLEKMEAEGTKKMKKKKKRR